MVATEGVELWPEPSRTSYFLPKTVHSHTRTGRSFTNQKALRLFLACTGHLIWFLIAFASMFSAAAATFSSRCLTLEVPGIGSMTGDRASNHARATCEGVAFHRAAMRPARLSGLETRPAPKETTEMNPSFSFWQYSRHRPTRGQRCCNDSGR